MGLPAVVTNDIEALRKRYVPQRRCSSCAHLHVDGFVCCGMGMWKSARPGGEQVRRFDEVVYGDDPTFEACDHFQWAAMTEDEFRQRGVELVEVARACFILLGELIQWKIEREQAVTDDSRRVIIERYSAAWGVSQSSLWKAWVLVAKFPLLPRPEDAPPTLTYEILSGCETEKEAEQVLDLALGGGWSARDVREIKALRAQGLLGDWQRLRLVCDGDTVFVTDGNCQVPVAVLTGDSAMARAGAALLRMRGGF